MYAETYFGLKQLIVVLVTVCVSVVIEIYFATMTDKNIEEGAMYKGYPFAKNPKICSLYETCEESHDKEISCEANDETVIVPTKDKCEAVEWDSTGYSQDGLPVYISSWLYEDKISEIRKMEVNNLLKPCGHLLTPVAILPPVPFTLIVRITQQIEKFNNPFCFKNGKALNYPPRLPQVSLKQPKYPTSNRIPRGPLLTICETPDRIVLTWRMINKTLSHYEILNSFEVYMCLEKDEEPTADMWQKIETVRVIDGPKICTSVNLLNGYRYHFAVRGVDVAARTGAFSKPQNVLVHK